MSHIPSMLRLSGTRAKAIQSRRRPCRVSFASALRAECFPIPVEDNVSHFARACGASGEYEMEGTGTAPNGLPPYKVKKKLGFRVVEAAALVKYDGNGNLLEDGDGHAYQWDAENRLIGIAYQDGSRTEIVYDGASRRVKLVEKNADGTVASHKRLVWCGMEICEERDAQNAVQKRYYAEGMQKRESGGAGGGSTTTTLVSYYTTRDHLGSIREMTDASGAVRARYSYDPYGVRTKLSGDQEADFGFTGHYVHGPSGLHLAPYRGYDAKRGRWISRDPIEERGGINLYGYVGNEPVGAWDPLGLMVWGNGEGAFRARLEMMETDEGRNTIREVESLEKETGKTVRVESEQGPEAWDYQPATRTVRLPNNPLPVNTTKGPRQETWGETANHELIHAKQDLSGVLECRRDTPDAQHTNDAEREAIESTNRMSAELHRAPRVDHYYIPAWQKTRRTR